ncbi:MAG: FAD-dependent oxidoreductase [Planctomycetota bacterium]|nr:FAD-dependent oxidoreductase [Planctomycetota bacterium]
MRYATPRDPDAGRRTSNTIPAEAICVVGAGIAGLACARRLASRNAQVIVLDKGRCPGGRASTRGEGAQAYDHGAQYLTARDPRFLREVESWRRAGIAAEWSGRVGVLHGGVATSSEGSTRRFVGRPSMGAIARHLARGLDVRCSTRALAIEGEPGAWAVATEAGASLGPFAHVIVSAPPPQSADLLERAAPDIAAALRGVRARPCWALMVDFDGPLPLALDGAFVHDSHLAWIAREASKPDRAAGERWILHASPEWSAAHLELDAGWIARELLAALTDALACAVPSARQAVAHRWRFATPDPVLPNPHLLDEELGLGACGDALGGPRVEGAWLSGTSLAEALRVRA